MGFETEMAALRDKREATQKAYRRQFHDLCDGGASIEDACDKLEIQYSLGYRWAAKAEWHLVLSEEQQSLLAKSREHMRAEQRAYLRKEVLGK